MNLVVDETTNFTWQKHVLQKKTLDIEEQGEMSIADIHS